MAPAVGPQPQDVAPQGDHQGARHPPAVQTFSQHHPAGEDQENRGKGQERDAQREVAEAQGPHVKERGEDLQGQHGRHDEPERLASAPAD